jgi:signal transduction histidine kinase
MGTMARLRSIRVRILVPVLVATLGVVALGWVQVDDALTVAAQAGRAELLSQASGAIVNLVHEVGQEYVDTNEADRRGEPGHALLAAQQERTDAARAAYTVAMRQTVAAVPALGRLNDGAERALELLGSTRQTAPASGDFQIEVSAAYATMRQALIALAQAIPPQLTQTRLIEDARAVALAAELDYLAAQQLDLLLRAFHTQRLVQGELVQLASLEGRERNQREALQNLPGAAANRLGELTEGPAVGMAAQLRDAVLATGGEPGALAVALRVDPSRWYGAQGEVLNRMRGMEAELTAGLQRDAHRVGQAAKGRTLLAGGLTALVVVATLTAAMVLAARTSRRLRRMRYAVLTAARSELPAAIAEVIAAGDAEAVHAAVNDSWNRIDTMLAQGADEIAELGAAFGAVHRQALRLAADQALLRMEVEAMFVALSRRGQTLVQRQIHLIDEFGRLETDPEALGRLFALDHLAARMRRNEENLLVLAGGEPARWVSGPVAAIDVVRAAAQEIEEYKRIVVATTPPIAVAAFAAGNVIHLLAELLENATSFSAPSTPVRVVARRGVEGLTITVHDEGIGMPDDRVAEANQRLAQPAALTSTLVGTMGLLVVARLAQRHQMLVRLTSSPGNGTAATVVLPDHILDPLPVADQLHTGRWLEQTADAGRGPAPPVRSATPPPEPALRSLPEPADTAAPRAVTTAAGLPRRGPGATTPDPADGAEDRRPPGPPDPETVRARLSSLAKGLAAANRQPSDRPS